MRYLLDRDDDGHWYLIPAELHEQFTNWVYGELGTPGPTDVLSLGSHPNSVTFSAPEHFGQPVGGATRMQLTPEIERALYAQLAEAEPGRHHAAVRRGLAAAFRAAGFEVDE